MPKGVKQVIPNAEDKSNPDSGNYTPPTEVIIPEDASPTDIRQTNVPDRWSDIEHDQKPDFIYGGPFIRSPTPAPLIDTATPRNVQLQAIWKQSFAYHTVRERLPIIITRVIDYLSRAKDSIKAQHGATDEDLIEAIQYCTKLKSDIVTNKRLEPLRPESEEAERWNRWIAAEQQPYYFTAVWVFTECYVYRRLREAFAHNERLRDLDPFQAQKVEAFAQNVDAMAAVARHLDTMVQGDNDKESLVTLLKLALWANKCDLSLSAGAEVDCVRDPVAAVTAWRDKLLVDDAGRIADFIVDKGAALAKKIEEALHEEDALEDSADAEGEAPPKPPCPTKMTVPQSVMIDIICDNAGYELFMDLCIGHFLLTKNMVQKVRYHVKAIPWFVSDVTPADFHYVIAACSSAQVPPSQPAEGEDSQPASSEQLQELGRQWQQHVVEGRFQVEVDSFWTSPHVFKDMKRHDPALYRKLQFPLCAIFKGDLNYRKLVGERNWPPTTSFEQALEGFHPAPLVAVRTVKAELIAGLPKGKYEQLQALDEKWMEKGEYGLIQFCPKKEDLKVSDMPCAEFGISCNGAVC